MLGLTRGDDASNNGAMAEHVSRLPFALDLLIAEAKQRRRRRLLGVGAVVLLVGGATAGALLSRSSPGPGASGPTSAGLAHHYRSSQGWSLRYGNGMSVEHASASGISYAIDEVTFSSFKSRPGVLQRNTSGGETIRPMPPRAQGGSFPTDGIAVRVLSEQSLGHPTQPATQLPLQLSSFRTGGRMFSGWYPGTYPRPLQHLLVWKSQWAFVRVQVWIGPKASAGERALVERIVASIAVRQPTDTK